MDAILFHATVVHSIAEFQFMRNCHDYAWSPYMSSMWDQGTEGDQKECWFMWDNRSEQPEPFTRNWSDGSVTNKVTSRAFDPVLDNEYVFSNSDVQQLNDYIDEEWFPIPFPVCPLDSLDAVPAHSAVVSVDLFEPTT